MLALDITTFLTSKWSLMMMMPQRGNSQLMWWRSDQWVCVCVLHHTIHRVQSHSQVFFPSKTHETMLTHWFEDCEAGKLIVNVSTHWTIAQVKHCCIKVGWERLYDQLKDNTAFIVRLETHLQDPAPVPVIKAHCACGTVWWRAAEEVSVDAAESASVRAANWREGWGRWEVWHLQMPLSPPLGN